MPIKIESSTTVKLPRNTEDHLKRLLDCLPREHVRGIDRLRLVDSIDDPRLRLRQASNLPGLYHPRQGTQPAWIEVSVQALLPQVKPFYRRLMPRLSFRANLAALLFSLVGQHYYLTLRHSVKKTQLEPAVRAYTEKHLRAWNEREHSLRARLFKPLQPRFERWARALQRRAAQNNQKNPR